MNQWDDMDSKQKTRHIVEDVMHWECFESWEDYLHKYGEQEHGLGEGKLYTTPTPVAFYAGEWRVFSGDHEELTVFDPLRNYDDALKVTTALKERGIEITCENVPRAICRAAYEATQPGDQ